MRRLVPVGGGFLRSFSRGVNHYDANGNMAYDPNKDMEILYNHLNLPKRIKI